ncbi:MAG: hypothetical protein R3Y08_01735 [Rikenellaceae bacterium]
MRWLIVQLIVIFHIVPCCAQRLGIGYYDVDALYDTIPSRFYDDSAYTPTERYNWTSERYKRKIKNIAAVIDSMSLSAIGLFGVENEGVVRDIVRACTQDYTFIHATRNSFDGTDFALLYFGDKLFVEGFESVVGGRNMLVVKAMLFDDTPITMIFSRSGDDTIEYLRDQEPSDLVVVMGMLYQDEIERMGYENILRAREQHGEGNYFSFRGYVMRDRIAVNNSAKILKSGVYITPWLLTPDKVRPLPTIDKGHYKGGYSKYLPIFAYIL